MCPFPPQFYILPFGNNTRSVHDPLFHIENTLLLFIVVSFQVSGLPLTFLLVLIHMLFCSSAASLVAVSIVTHISSALFNVSLSMDSNFFCVFSQLWPQTKHSLNVSSRDNTYAPCSDNLGSCAIWSLTLSSDYWSLLWKQTLSAITICLGLKWFFKTSTISWYD